MRHDVSDVLGLFQMYTMPKIGIHFLKKNESTRAVVICHG